MSKSKLPFEERIPIVFKIINDAKEPIGYTELHEKLKAETGIKISKHTLNKCLNSLLFYRQIEKTETKGRGNPVKYSLTREGFSSKPNMRIEGNAYTLSHLLNNNTPWGAEANHYTFIAQEISLIVVRLLMNLAIYSQQNNRKKALDDYKLAIETELVPYVLELRKLVTPPRKMSRITYELLETAFHTQITEYLKGQNHPLQKITKEETSEVINRYANLVRSRPEEKYFFQIKEAPETFNSDYLDKRIKEAERLGEYLNEIRRKKKNEES